MSLALTYGCWIKGVITIGANKTAERGVLATPTNKAPQITEIHDLNLTIAEDTEGRERR